MNEPSKTELSRAKLALQLIPYVTRADVFALKGGAAINFFYQPLPRISTDLDLCYTPVRPREETLRDIDAKIIAVAESFTRDYPNYSYRIKNRSELKTACTVEILSESYGVKVEPNLVLRGNFLPTELVKTRPELEAHDLPSQQMKTIAQEEVYAGKICAALDRQLPRDLFDIKLMLETFGYTEKLKDTFLVYLLYQGRPFEEILTPHRLPFTKEGIENLDGIAFHSYTAEQLINTRERLIETVNKSFTDKDKEFLISIMDKPKWDLAPFPDLERFPGVQWKLLNVKKMDAKKRVQATKKLEAALSRDLDIARE